METFEYTYTPDGSEDPVTIKVPLPEGTISATDAENFMPKSAFGTELARRVESIVAKKRDDKEYKKELLAHWDIDPEGKKGDIDATIEERLRAERASWDTGTLKPVQEELDTAQGRIGKLLNSRLQAEILAASANVKEPFRTAPRAGIRPAIVSTVDELFGFDAETDSFFVKDGDSFAFTKAPKEGASPFMGVPEYMAEFLGREENRELLADVRQRGPGVDGSTGGNKGGEAAYTLTREQATDPAQYRAASKLAKEAGRAMPIVLRQ